MYNLDNKPIFKGISFSLCWWKLNIVILVKVFVHCSSAIYCMLDTLCIFYTKCPTCLWSLTVLTAKQVIKKHTIALHQSYLFTQYSTTWAKCTSWHCSCFLCVLHPIISCISQSCAGSQNYSLFSFAFSGCELENDEYYTVFDVQTPAWSLFAQERAVGGNNWTHNCQSSSAGVKGHYT